MRKLKQSELRLARQYGLSLGTCVMCKRKGVTSTLFFFKDSKMQRMFGLAGTHILCGVSYIVNGKRVDTINDLDLSERLYICNSCSKKHEDQRYRDEQGNNSRGTP